MASITYRANLRAAFPPSSFFNAGRTFITTGGVQQGHTGPGSSDFTGSETGVNTGLPQILAMRNCIPTREGVRALGLTSGLNISTNKNLFGAKEQYDGQTYVMYRHSAGTVYVDGYGPDFSLQTALSVDITWNPGWNNFTVLPLGKGRILATWGLNFNNFTLSGFTSGAGAIHYTIAGIPLGSSVIRGIAVVSNRILVLDGVGNLYKSAIIETLPGAGGTIDFTPNSVTGAGSDTIGSQYGGSGGDIFQLEDGAAVFYRHQVLYVRPTGDTIFPFIYSAIPGVGGLPYGQTKETISWDETTQFLYTVDAAGVKVVSGQKATIVEEKLMPYVHNTDILLRDTGFIDRRESIQGAVDFPVSEAQYVGISSSTDFQSLRTTTPTLLPSNPIAQVTAVRVLSGRYIALLTQYNNFSSVVIHLWDILLKRMGIIYTNTTTIGHVGYSPLREIFYYITGSGDRILCTPHLNYDTATHGFPDYTKSLVALGKYELAPGVHSSLEELEIEGGLFTAPYEAANATRRLDIRTIKSLDGNTWYPEVIPSRVVNSHYQRKYVQRSTGLNHIVQISGAFDLSSLVLKFEQAGER